MAKWGVPESPGSGWTPAELDSLIPTAKDLEIDAALDVGASPAQAEWFAERMLVNNIKIKQETLAEMSSYIAFEDFWDLATTICIILIHIVGMSLGSL